MAGGLGLVVIFSEQEGKFFKGVLKGLGGLFPTFLDSIGAFADIISYIRLFAVGLATVEIAKAFNAMASDMGASVVGFIGAILVLLIGHGLNLAMGAMSVVVHGVRLNMLEFSGHLGMEWSGVAYTPFSNGTEEAAKAVDQLESHETDSVRSNER
jgi:V/A-type H+-transporting ATPase subunit I